MLEAPDEDRSEAYSARPTMNTLSRQEKLARFQTLTKVNGITTGREFKELRSTVDLKKESNIEPKTSAVFQTEIK